MNQQVDHKATAKIVWMAMTMSVLIYGFVLFQIGKASLFEVPKSFENPIELLALVAPSMLFASLLVNKSMRAKATLPQQHFTAMIISLAMNEFIAIMGFLATFTGDPANVFFYGANALVAVVGNCLIFPSGDWTKQR
jgi:hypothetical protein